MSNMFYCEMGHSMSTSEYHMFVMHIYLKS